MKKRIKDIIITFTVMAVICIVMWNMGWISSFSDVAKIYASLIMIIGFSILYDLLDKKFSK